ncbi:bifunctional adenosylcobinamide kinase/adenosylcobinamide-phosphate guanylyltransferase [Derxia lacustris]|uniref:bifunctional adenosylcobinamide kinase/adenosylcobinamide-phosphate guanylyltransferase n=1 Tax=Derxia lacustris TaxID=764842 RepID=UPI000A170DB3|nr:bifunctional adenosylcobinamide kinase/adenosylcobinamide-phosphate guanylyltransferase [Derxia lacustris]
MTDIASTELILGGQKSGKSRRAEQLAERWLAAAPAREACFIATARAGDDEMRARIERHRADRAARLPRMVTVEAPLQLGATLAAESRPGRLVVVDCLTLWLANLLLPAAPSEPADPAPEIAALLDALGAARAPVLLVGNEIGLGVIPLGRETRAFVDALGLLNQRVAAACARVTLMAAGLPLTLKEAR